MTLNNTSQHRAPPLIALSLANSHFHEFHKGEKAACFESLSTNGDSLAPHPALSPHAGRGLFISLVISVPGSRRAGGAGLVAAGDGRKNCG